MIFGGTRPWKRCGYHRMKFGDLPVFEVARTNPPRWLNCRPMAHLPSSVSAGSVLCHLFVSEKLKSHELDRDLTLVKTEPFELRAHICMARHLSSTHDERNPNAFVEITCAGSTACSQT